MSAIMSLYNCQPGTLRFSTTECGGTNRAWSLLSKLLGGSLNKVARLGRASSRCAQPGTRLCQQ